MEQVAQSSFRKCNLTPVNIVRYSDEGALHATDGQWFFSIDTFPSSYICISGGMTEFEIKYSVTQM